MIKDQKRGKRHEVVINNSIKQALTEYLKAYLGVDNNPEYHIFFNTKTNIHTEPIKRDQAWKFITTICRDVGLQGNYGTHSLRKTWGYYARMNGVDLALIMHKLIIHEMQGEAARVMDELVTPIRVEISESINNNLQ